MKRSHGDGSIQPRGDSWRIRYRINGERFEKTVKGSRADAAKALREALKAGDDGKHVAPAKLTYGQWVDQWLALKSPALKGRTHERYSDLLRRYAIPVLGGTPLQALRGTDIDKLYLGLSVAPGTLALLHRVLKACLATAVRKRLLSHNPASDAERPRLPDPDDTILDEEELMTLVKGFEGSSIYEIVAFAALTGARRNEILALRWADIDLAQGIVSISRNVEVTRQHGRRITTPKSARGVRRFQIDEGLVAMLAKRKLGIGPSQKSDDALVFPGADGEIRCPETITSLFFHRARALGHAIHFHTLRASHETALLDRGVPLHVVAKRCGHDPAMLLRSYARRTRKADDGAAKAIGAMGGGLWGQPSGK